MNWNWQLGDVPRVRFACWKARKGSTDEGAGSSLLRVYSEACWIASATAKVTSSITGAVLVSVLVQLLLLGCRDGLLLGPF